MYILQDIIIVFIMNLNIRSACRPVKLVTFQVTGAPDFSKITDHEISLISIKVTYQLSYLRFDDLNMAQIA